MGGEGDFLKIGTPGSAPGSLNQHALGERPEGSEFLHPAHPGHAPTASLHIHALYHDNYRQSLKTVLLAPVYHLSPISAAHVTTLALWASLGVHTHVDPHVSVPPAGAGPSTSLLVFLEEG